MGARDWGDEQAREIFFQGQYRGDDRAGLGINISIFWGNRNPGFGFTAGDERAGWKIA